MFNFFLTKKIKLHTYFVCTFLSLFSCLIHQKTNAQNQKPNIIFILGDDIGYNTLTVNGGRSYSTPNLDSMARHGMNFTQCHASPMCSPSRVTLLTGKYNFRNYFQWAILDTAQKTFGNIFKNAGYATGWFGKWQLNGGETSINKIGFDSYCVFDPFEYSVTNKYKNPRIYTNGAFVPDNLNAGKYGEDIFTDSAMNFIERNKSVPFLLYYPMGLSHAPFQPTPDNAAYAPWNSTTKSDTTYYPSMIKYMDKKIGQVLNKVKELGIENNTLIIYCGDNGTPASISQYIDGDSLITGGKSTTTELGTHVPLIMYWPNTISAGSINNDLIDFTDFLPTFAGVAGLQIPSGYTPLDGVSFSSRLTGGAGTPRNWIFYTYDPYPGISKLQRWAQTSVYKLYDTSAYNKQLLFYNISKDINEKTPIADASLTPSEGAIKQQLLNVINGYVAQGVPIFSKPAFGSLTDSAVILKDTILSNGGSTITASGFVWSPNPNPTTSSTKTTNNVKIGAFSSTIKGLVSNKTYYVRAYATNKAGTSYSSQVSFKILFHAPVATAATAIDSNQFIANWNKVSDTNYYQLDVSQYPTFSIPQTASLTQGFNSNYFPPAGWNYITAVDISTTSFGQASPSILFFANRAQLVTPVLNGTATQLKFWIKALSTSASNSLLIEGFNGTKWVTIQKITTLPKTATIKTYDASTNPALPANINQFRFTYTKSGSASLAFDDVAINYNTSVPSYISGYNSLRANTNTQLVTGLTPATTYYYRVRSVTPSNISVNSKVISVYTCKKSTIASVAIKNINCNNGNDGEINVSVTDSSGALAYSWTGPNNFTSSLKNIDHLFAGNYKLTITTNGGCSIDTTVAVMQPQQIDATTKAEAITCAGGTTTLTVAATGGTGNYHYSLSDGVNTTGPQDDNHFTVTAGNYTVFVEDDNHCSLTTSSIQITEPTAINATVNADAITCAGGTTTLTVTATGGTGNYHYSLSDGTNTTGQQDDNHFTVIAGSYTVTVTDDNGCTINTSLNIDDGEGSCNNIAANNKSNINIKNNSGIKSNELQVQLYPNPTSGYFSMQLNSSSNEKIKIRITDIYGKIIYESSNSYSKNILLKKQLSAGLYFVQVTQGNNFKTLRLIKEW